jgi:hypothetical protein
MALQYSMKRFCRLFKRTQKPAVVAIAEIQKVYRVHQNPDDLSPLSPWARALG